ncbi:hypothetical protein [Priestia megaterium]
MNRSDLFIGLVNEGFAYLTMSQALFLRSHYLLKCLMAESFKEKSSLVSAV